jgi:predicted Zn-dependent protease
VLAHEISHVTQRHLARLLNKSGQGQVASLLALAVAILAARSSPDLAVGGDDGGAGAWRSRTSSTTRAISSARPIASASNCWSGPDFDIRGMSGFFERMQKFGRLYENNAPGYLRTHP